MDRRDFLKTATTVAGVAATEGLVNPLLRAESMRHDDGSKAGGVQVAELRCESTVNPLGIDSRAPRLSWILTSPKKGQRQTAYQILVASDEGKLRNNQADIWDSGKIISEQSTQVAYPGPALDARRRYFWKVRAWDKDGEASPYSEIAWWEMALLSPEDWKAEWIGHLAAWPGRALYFRAELPISKAVECARIYVSGLGYYELRLNGSKVGDHVLDPGVTDYNKRILYSTYDVTGQLKQGPNTIGVIVGNGWYGVPRLILQCEVTYADGSVETVYSHKGGFQRGGRWFVTSGPILENSVYGGETYDARLEKDGWDVPTDAADLRKMRFDRSEGWAPIYNVPSPGGLLTAQTVNPIKIVDSIRPKSVSEPKPGIYVFDIGQNMAGWAQLQVIGEPGTRVVLKFAEMLLKDGTVDQSNLYIATATDVYILKGKGTEWWEPRFTYHGFRYIQLEGFPGKASLDTVTARVVRSSVEPAGTIETSDDLINRIQKMVWWTEASNLYSIPTDCPQRSERLGWMNDLTVRAEEAIYNFNMSRFYPKFLSDIRDSQTDDGAIPDTVPYGMGSRPADPVSTSYLLLAWLSYQHYNDTRVLAQHFDGFRAWTDFLYNKTKNNIVTYGYYGDWSPPKAFAVPASMGSGAESKNTPLEFMSTGYLYYDAKLVSQMAEVLGKRDDQTKYAKIAQQVAASFNSKYWNEAAGGYGSNNEAMDSLALFLGIVPEDRVQRVLASLVKAVHDNGDHLSTGNLCTKYVLEALTNYGRGDLAYKIATQETYPSWGYMLANDATTLWERWEPLTGAGMNSHNHPMMGSVSSWFHKYLGGINPDPERPGFKRIVIRPYLLADLKSVRAEYQSQYGPIRSSWSRENGKLTLKVTVPVNTTARVYVPAVDGTSITVGREQADSAEGVKSLGRQAGAWVFEVGSGDYEFVAS